MKRNNEYIKRGGWVKFYIRKNATVSDLVKLKGGKTDGRDKVFISNGSTLTMDSDATLASPMRIGTKKKPGGVVITSDITLTLIRHPKWKINRKTKRFEMVGRGK